MAIYPGVPRDEYSKGPKLTFSDRRQLVTEIYFQSSDGKCGRQVVSINFSFTATQKRELIQEVSSHENIPV